MRRAIFTAVLLAGCAAAPPCPEGSQAAVLEQLWLGSSRAHGPEVTAQEWSAFVREEIAPRLPQGFTVLEAQGQWRNADGSVAQERTHVLQLLHPDDAGSAAELHQIAGRYRARFDQEAVLHSGQAACMTLYR
jgi:hypothetical protein